MKNLEIYNKLKSVPEEFTKKIKAGRLKGMTDIKPQWRIMKMTEEFGVCGFGWWTQNVNYEYTEGGGGEIVCNCRLELIIVIDGKESKPISSTGGSKLSTMERNGLYVSDEAEKMAYTDALSVAMKMIGVASDIYMGLSDSKYSVVESAKPTPKAFTLEDVNRAIEKGKQADALKLIESGKYTASEDLIKELKK